MSGRYLNIGSWNIEHFGKIDNNTENQYAIAQHIELSGCDIISLQELYLTSAPPEYKNSHLQDSLDLVKEHTAQEWKYEIFPNRRGDDDSQLCGIAWNSSKVNKTITYKIPVDYTKTINNKEYWLWDRSPHAVKFETEGDKTDIAVITLHMKANTDARHIVELKRELEVKTLLENLQNIEDAVQDKDLIFLGDTNCLSRQENAIQEFTRHGFNDLNEDDTGTYYRGDAPFDRIFVPTDRKAFKYSRQYILRSASPYAHEKYLSDHYIIKTMVKIIKDDDYA